MNGLNREGTISVYEASRPEKGTGTGVEVMGVQGAVQSEVVRLVREVLAPELASATI